MKYRILIAATVLSLLFVLYFVWAGAVAVGHVYGKALDAKELVLNTTVENIVQDIAYTKREVCARYNLELANHEDELYRLLIQTDPILTIPEYFKKLDNQEKWAWVLYDYKTFKPMLSSSNVDQWKNLAYLLHKKISAGKTIYSHSVMLMYGITSVHLERELLTIFHEKLHSYEFSQGTGLSVRKALDWNGGEKWSVNLICPDHRDQEGVYIDSDLTDARARNYYLQEMNSLKVTGKNIDYLYEMFEDNRDIARFLSYSVLVKDFDWIISMKMPSSQNEDGQSDIWLQKLSADRFCLCVSMALFVAALFCLLLFVHIDISTINRRRRKFEH